MAVDEGLPLPGDFLRRMSRYLGGEYPMFAASYGQRQVDGLRINELKTDPVTLAGLLPVDLLPLTWCPAGFTIPPDALLGHHPYHAAGLYYLQEPSAMAVAQVMTPQPGERILDLCAAPGGKATHITSLMGDQGLLVANDVHPRRVRALVENLERWGATNAIVLNETPDRLALHFPAFFDRVLVDAPCSGEGMFRRSEIARAHWSVEHVQGCTRRQREILALASQMVRPGGWLCYATCTFAPEENEGVIASFLDRHPEFEIIEPTRADGFDRGRPEWVGTSHPLERAVRIWPHRAPGEGHFIVLMQRMREQRASKERRRRSRPSAPAGGLLAEFCQAHLTVEIEGRLVLMGPHLYRPPSDAPDLADLRVVRPGWWVGSVRRRRFEPSHALAMALRREEARRVLSLSAEAPEVYAYLQGRPLRSSGEDGWVLVALDGYPLGWGKRVNGVVKNHYPRRLRWR